MKKRDMQDDWEEAVELGRQDKEREKYGKGRQRREKNKFSSRVTLSFPS